MICPISNFIKARKQAFIAEVLELSGCAAEGITYQKALANAVVAIQEWMEIAKEPGRPVPEPKGKLVFQIVTENRILIFQ